MWSDLDGLIEQAGLQQAAELIRSLLRPAIRLTGGDRQSGSHLGGLPLLPASIPWPLDPDGAPLACLAQINLAEVADSDVEQRLPPDGLLTFFGAPEWLQSAQAGPDRSWWRVAYVAASESVEAAEPPSDQFDPTVYDRLDVQPSLELTLPTLDFWGPRRPLLERIVGDGRANWQQYADLHTNLGRLSGGTQPVHRMLGYPWPVQEDPLQEDPLEAQPRRRLLLQIDDEYRAGLSVGDSGSLYFVIGGRELDQRNFEDVDLFAQCS